MPAHDLHPRPVAAAGAAILATVLLAVATVILLLQLWELPAGADRVRVTEVAPQAATLQSAPQDDLARYREEKRKLLASRGWVDRPAGIARIPISDAIDVLAAPRSPASARVSP